jgi:putative ABC transport system permease protein
VVNNDIKPNFLKPRWSKVFSDLWDDKTRSSLIVASIAVGVFAVGMIITAFVVLREDVNSNYSAANPVNIEIWAGPFYEDLVRVIEKLPGVDNVESRQIIPIRARRGDENWQGLSLVGIKNFDDLVINQLITIEGNQFPSKNEVIVSKDVINDTGFLVGDEIEIELPDGSTHYLYVVGLVYD